MTRERELLVEQNIGLARREARRWSHVPLEQEELVADGLEGLVRAALRYDPGRGIPFVPFALLYVRGAILDTLRARTRRQDLRDGRFADDVSLEGLRELRATFDLADPRPGPADVVETLETLRVLATMPARERFALIRTTVDGADAAAVGVELGVSRDRVYQLAHSGSRRLRRRAA